MNNNKPNITFKTNSFSFNKHYNNKLISKNNDLSMD